MIPDTPPSSAAKPVVDYAVRAPGRRPRTITIVLIWLVPALIESLGWLVLFHFYPDEYTSIPSRNMIASIAGFPLTTCIGFKLVPWNSLPAYVAVAAISWAVILSVVTRQWARRVPIIAHLLLSPFWTFGGAFTYFALTW